MSKQVLSTQEEIKSKSKNIRVRLQSKFYGEVGEIPHNEYPRPQFERDSFFNLNGTWDFCMQDASAEFKGYDSKILVPFSPESLLSGLDGKICQPTDVLYYKREFTLPKGFIKSRTFLNFGAVDFECEVKINSKVVGTHKGGFVPFTFDVTDSIKEGVNTVEVKVTDPTDTSYHTRAKQALKNGGIWYTPQSGIIFSRYAHRARYRQRQRKDKTRARRRRRGDGQGIRRKKGNSESTNEKRRGSPQH